MIELREFNRFLSILGFREVRISSINDFLKRVRKKTKHVPLQVFDANCIAGTRHLLFATLNALNAFEQNQSISERLEVEILLYASGQRQISKAIGMIGLKQGTSEIAVAFVTTNRDDVKEIEAEVSEIVSGERDDGVLGFREGKVGRLIEVFGITDLELETISESRESLWESLVATIVERTALLAIKR